MPPYLARGEPLGSRGDLPCFHNNVYRDLWAWIDDPFQPPPIPESSSEQLTLQLI